MKLIGFFGVSFGVLLSLTSCGPLEAPDYIGHSDISIMSFNLRYDEPKDGVNQWENRKQASIKMFNETKPSIFGIQEGLHHQVEFLDKNLSNYKYVGVGRDDGRLAGEYSAIFYVTNRFEVLESGNFWLSETPETPSRGWDANNIRIVTWVKLKDIEKARTIYVFNTHFDHKGTVSQRESSKLLAEKIRNIENPSAPVFITGDFNMLFNNSKLRPITKKYASAQESSAISDGNNSFNAFGKWVLNRNIDHIFYRNATALAYKTIVKNYGPLFISDHYPILAHFNY